jgi:hypothetical protein
LAHPSVSTALVQQLAPLSSSARIALATATALAALLLVFLITVAGLSTWRRNGSRRR